MYETPGGTSIIEDFIRKLQPSTQAKLMRQIELLEEFGIALGMPHAKALGGGLYELRERQAGGEDFLCFCCRKEYLSFACLPKEITDYPKT